MTCDVLGNRSSSNFDGKHMVKAECILTSMFLAFLEITVHHHVVTICSELLSIMQIVYLMQCDDLSDSITRSLILTCNTGC